MRRVIEFFDLDDGAGHLSLPKLAGIAVLVVALVLPFLHGAMTWAHIVAIVCAISALFGRNVWRQWLQRVTVGVTGTQAVTVDAAKVIEAIRGERDEQAGIEVPPPRAR